jgi:sulfur-carrier protein
MKINILAFGQVAGITGNNVVLEESVSDTEGLKYALHKRYPALGELKYAIAVDKKMIHENVDLSDNATVALLPPFSGG